MYNCDGKKKINGDVKPFPKVESYYLMQDSSKKILV